MDDDFTYDDLDSCDLDLLRQERNELGEDEYGCRDADYR